MASLNKILISKKYKCKLSHCSIHYKHKSANLLYRVMCDHLIVRVLSFSPKNTIDNIYIPWVKPQNKRAIQIELINIRNFNYVNESTRLDIVFFKKYNLHLRFFLYILSITTFKQTRFCCFIDYGWQKVASKTHIFISHWQHLCNWEFNQICYVIVSNVSIS